MTELEKEIKTAKLIRDKSLEELLYILGRYCGPHNTILCEKQFGFRLNKKIIEQAIIGLSIDDWLVNNSN
jgi:hypothetical protein